MACTCPPASRSADQQQSASKLSTVIACSSQQPPSNHQPSLAVITSSPNLRGNRFAALASIDDDDHSEVVRCDDMPLTVVTKRKKRMRQRGDTPPQSSGSNQPVSQPINQLNRTELQRQQQRAPVIFGRATSTDTKVSAARRFRKKTVYCLDNINKDCTVDDIKSYVSKLSVEVFTCYKVKPRRRRSDAEENENGDEESSSERREEKRAAFRLCVAADDRNRLLDPAA